MKTVEKLSVLGLKLKAVVRGLYLVFQRKLDEAGGTHTSALYMPNAEKYIDVPNILVLKACEILDPMSSESFTNDDNWKKAGLQVLKHLSKPEEFDALLAEANENQDILHIVLETNLSVDTHIIENFKNKALFFFLSGRKNTLQTIDQHLNPIPHHVDEWANVGILYSDLYSEFTPCLAVTPQWWEFNKKYIPEFDFESFLNQLLYNLKVEYVSDIGDQRAHIAKVAADIAARITSSEEVVAELAE